MMNQIIKDFNKQFEYEPEVQNADKLKKTGKFIICGMGGSHLAADILDVENPYLNIIVHSDYGLPTLSDEILREYLVIVSSYSGNTEEAIHSFNEAIKKGLNIAVVSTGGKLIELAKDEGVPYIQMPEVGIQPRLALGFGVNALLKLIGDEEALRDAKKVANLLDPSSFERDGKNLAERLNGFVPIIYASKRNLAIAYNWKTKFNETGKIPAFYNIFPELSHNEIQGFDVKDSTKDLSKNFYFIILKDKTDHPRILKRMEVLEGQYKERGLPVEAIELNGENVFHKIFSSLVLADWAAFYIVEGYGLEAEQIPMIEEFKKLLLE